MKQANTTSEELDKILARHGAEAGELTASLKDALLAWRDAAVVEAEKTMADNLIDQEARLYKVFSDDDKICVGIKKMADEVREYYDGGVYEKN